ncbi:hypothetical protein [Methylobacterium sp. J-092]|uniref:hypothetical protein n=1 Tax=Methylobacterium sp. J-092 TaxID=2836667 RepID=UPI001FB8B7FF|nr:hypothetical protein [Methylobacterium sp. J-092]MCJ2006774.1 hypothetical protein [Methylobacterium sp. J-092]
MRVLAITVTIASMAAFATTSASPEVSVDAGDAPFGLSWGPVDAVPRPLKVDREANLTTLYYPHGWPPTLRAGTAEAVLVVCGDDERGRRRPRGVPARHDSPCELTCSG